MFTRRSKTKAGLKNYKGSLVFGISVILCVNGCQFHPINYLNHKFAGVFLNQAIRLENLREYNQAQTMSNISLWLEPRAPLSLYVRGIIYLDKNENHKAIVDFTAALDCVPERKRDKARDLERFARETEWLFLFRGRCYTNLGEYGKAMADFQYALKANPRFAAAYFSQGEIYYKTQQYEAALDRFTQAIRLDPENEKAYNDRGLVFYCMEKYAEAAVDFTRAIELEADDVLYCNRGMAYLNQSEIQKAISDFNAALRFNPKSRDAYYYLGNAYEIHKDCEQAAAAYSQFMKLAEGPAQPPNRIAKAKAFLQSHPANFRTPWADSLDN